MTATRRMAHVLVHRQRREVAIGHSASVPLRDTKVADGPVVVVSRAAFAQLIGTFGRS
ncbi:DUF397 domain-containing protein [Streptomyces sp. NPDC006684]|uniref:DUF397 domain-containing protein n=1 Tax=Streptomyces sp. NPDC006684 TaxID=3154477 RepID=UPI003453F094